MSTLPDFFWVASWRSTLAAEDLPEEPYERMAAQSMSCQAVLERFSLADLEKFVAFTEEERARDFNNGAAVKNPFHLMFVHHTEDAALDSLKAGDTYWCEGSNENYFCAFAPTKVAALKTLVACLEQNGMK